MDDRTPQTLSLDFNSICRICMNNNCGKLLDIFNCSFAKKQIKYAEILNEYTVIKPQQDDSLPKNICKSCGLALKRVYLFNKKCEESDSKLKTLIALAVDSITIMPDYEDCKEENTVEDTSKIETDNESLPNDDDLVNDMDCDIKQEDDDIKQDDNEDDQSIKDEHSENESQSDPGWQPDMNTIIKEAKTAKEEKKAQKQLKKVVFKKQSTAMETIFLLTGRNAAHDARNRLQCHVCDKICQNRGNLRHHLLSHTDIKMHKCDKCHATYKSYTGLYKHRQSRHRQGNSSEKPFHCEICSKQFSLRKSLIQHLFIHGEKLYKCDKCGLSFVQSGQLYNHKLRHHAPPERQFLCQQCGKGGHTMKGEKIYKCDKCGLSFVQSGQLYNHKLRHHAPPERQFLCQQCGKGEHAMKGEKIYKCDKYGLSFVQSGQLYNHKLRHHAPPERQFLCQQCGKGFKVKGDLQVHERIHTGEKPYECDVCHKTFGTSGNLSIHMRFHTREPRRICKICNKKFLTTSAHIEHMKRHAGQRDHHCECGKSFYTSGCLKTHKLSHTGVKPYQCAVCERKFSQGSHLNRHFRKDHLKPGATMPPSSEFKRKLKDDIKMNFKT